MSGICGIPRRGSLSLVGCWDWPVSSTERRWVICGYLCVCLGKLLVSGIIFL
jgi:hypothetical protein